MNTRRPAGAPGLGFKSYKCNHCCINTRRPAGADGLGLLYDYYMYTIIIRTPGGRLELTELLDKIVDEEPPALNPAQVPATITCFYIYMLHVRVRVAASGFLIIVDEEPPPPAPRPAPRAGPRIAGTEPFAKAPRPRREGRRLPPARGPAPIGRPGGPLRSAGRAAARVVRRRASRRLVSGRVSVHPPCSCRLRVHRQAHRQASHGDARRAGLYSGPPACILKEGEAGDGGRGGWWERTVGRCRDQAAGGATTRSRPFVLRIGSSPLVPSQGDAIKRSRSPRHSPRHRARRRRQFSADFCGFINLTLKKRSPPPLPPPPRSPPAASLLIPISKAGPPGIREREREREG